ncbi:MAG TPA: phosphate/phosphite/phosphonate ABC transporter substrate-binding protein [Myxococcales bacterium]
MMRLLLIAALFACSKPAAQPLRVSLIPTTDPGKMLRENQPLVDYLSQRTGAKVQLTIPTNYAAVVEALVNDQLDIAHLGGFTYLQARKRAGVVPLVQRDRDQQFHSVFVTQPDSAIKSLDDLSGKSFAFGDVNSTSGHLMPEYYMRQRVDPDVISKALYTGGHDATLLAVVNGKVDAGALDEQVLARLIGEGKVDAAKVRVFYITPPFFDYVWVARKGLDPKIAEAVGQAFLELQGDNPILALFSATKYVRASDGDYDKLREAATVAGLLK